MKHGNAMSQYNAFFNRWLGQLGPDHVLSILTELLDSGAVFAVDNVGRILFWSKGAERLFGKSADSVLGQNCAEALCCNQTDDPCRLAELGEIKNQPVCIRQNNGEVLECLRTARAFFNAQGEFVGALEYLLPMPQTSQATPSPDKLKSFHGILSHDPVMQEAIKLIRNVAETEATVLIRGESGSGKELVARALHNESARCDQAFLAINCAALTPSLLESELFGHVKGAFTGAIRHHIGVFQRAHGGTLFLDEVAELPLELQAKLLRVIQERSFIPVGGSDAVHVDVRLIAATHRSLREEVKAGRFREDLMYRLRVVPVFLPPLRERRLDVKLLLWHYIEQLNLRSKRQISSIAPEAMRRLLDYAWPGNVRELINVVEYAFAVGRNQELTLDDLPPEFQESSAVAKQHRPPLFSTDEVSRIQEALNACNGRIDDAAAYLGMSRATFWRKRKKFNT
jgi:two-component system, NtrC family, response regulator AtoC